MSTGFIPKPGCTVSSGDCFRFGRCLDGCGRGSLAEQVNAAVLAERERCALLVEKMTARRRMIRGGVNGVPPEACEYAAAIRKGPQ